MHDPNKTYYWDVGKGGTKQVGCKGKCLRVHEREWEKVGGEGGGGG